MTALRAMLVDTYRELASRRLFWLSLALSALVVLSFALVGLNERGMTVLGYTLEIPFLNSTVLQKSEFYKLAFYTLGVRFWLAWLACLLALVSSAGLFPELVSSGTVETLLARPVPRHRLYLFKFLGGIVFTALQVTVFCVASFVVIGLRGGAWEPGIFLAVPMVTLLYSYLFSVCALIGTVTRSGIAALLLTVLVWGFLFTLGTSEQLVNGIRIAKTQEVAAIDRLIERRRERQAQACQAIARVTGVPALCTEPDTGELDTERTANQDALGTLTTAHRILFAAKTLLPKTDETTDLVQRWMVQAANLGDVADDEPEETPKPAPRRRRGPGSNFGTVRAKESAVLAAIAEDQRSRGVPWIVGTSLLFEAVVLAWGCRVFSRRDF
jgi:ABC-type transport system involved in multi-copper enzyme maturation permease subunit